ncbi:MAG TPA: NADP-dependent oxidoreductase, partial [Pseudoalteromonas shioyasakiensis]|nr:NADP-dependent oxidoreductase [Pseudoalteromonas shioyasakiensis]
MPDIQNRQYILETRPKGVANDKNVVLKTNSVPAPKDGEVLLRTIYLSLDPYMRGRMSDAESYADPVKIGDVMVGATVCQVEQSNHPDYQEGEWVLAYTG